MKYAKNSNYINLKCLSVHIGSQIVNNLPYEKMLKVIDKVIKKSNHKFEFVDLGGGDSNSNIYKNQKELRGRYKNPPGQILHILLIYCTHKLQRRGHLQPPKTLAYLYNVHHKNNPLNIIKQHFYFSFS